MRGHHWPAAEGVGAALAVPLALYAGVFGLFLWFLYGQLQPTVLRNPGLSAYQAPPGTIIDVRVPAGLSAAAESTQPVVALRSDPELPATDGRAPQRPDQEVAEPRPAETKPAQPKARPPARKAKPPPQERARPVTNYAAYPGYLGDRPF